MSTGPVRGRIEHPVQIEYIFRTEPQMQDRQDEGKRQSSVTTKLSDMQDSTRSGSNEDNSPVSAQTDRKTSAEGHPKKKRKVNHGQEFVTTSGQPETNSVSSMYLLSTLGEHVPSFSSFSQTNDRAYVKKDSS